MSAPITREEIRAQLATLKQEYDSARAAGQPRIAQEALRKASELLDQANVGEWGA